MGKGMNIFSHSKTSGQDYTLYALVFLVAIGARAFFLIWIDEPILFFKYPFFADKLCQGKDIGERLVDLSPFYLYFLTFFKKIFGIDWATAKLIQSFVGAFNALLVLALAKRLFNKTTGLLAGLIYALYGNVIILESTLEPTVFVVLFNLLSVYFLVLAKNDSRRLSQTASLIVAGGLFTGLSIITKPNFLLFLPLGVSWLLFSPTGTLNFHKRLAWAFIFCASALVVVTPVTIRNYVKLSDFVLVTADAGKVFYHGNSKAATAMDRATLPAIELSVEGSDEPDFAHVLFRKAAGKLTGKAISPSESSRFWIEQTFSDIYDDPPKYIRRILKKFVFFFTDYEVHYIASAYTEYKKSLSFPFIRYCIIVSFGILGMLLALKRFRQLFLVYGVIGVYLSACLLFLVQSRYRTPAVPYLCLFAGSAICGLKEMIKDRRFKALLLSLSACAAFFSLSHFAFKSEIANQDRWQEATKKHYEMRARLLYNQGRYGETIPELNRCLSIVPNFIPGLNLRGRVYAMLSQYEKAETDFKRVISLRPRASEGYRNIGFIYLLRGETDKARRHLRKALALTPHDKKVQKALEDLK
jgi:4-amino-4-deoxy-L-arabinose transferase-like glycosyltransferase